MFPQLSNCKPKVLEEDLHGRVSTGSGLDRTTDSSLYDEPGVLTEDEENAPCKRAENMARPYIRVIWLAGVPDSAKFFLGWDDETTGITPHRFKR